MVYNFITTLNQETKNNTPTLLKFSSKQFFFLKCYEIVSLEYEYKLINVPIGIVIKKHLKDIYDFLKLCVIFFFDITMKYIQKCFIKPNKSTKLIIFRFAEKNKSFKTSPWK